MDTPVLDSVEHALAQAGLVAYLWARRHRWDLQVLPGYGAADITVLKAGDPYLAIEIAPTDDRRIEQHLDSGLSFVWVIDPATRQAWIHSQDATVQVPDGWLRAEDIEVPLEEIFE